MVSAIIAMIFGVLLAVVAWRANDHFRAVPRLPMQWWLDGRVTWSAPRLVALAFIPIIGIALLAGYVALALTVPPRRGDEHLVVPGLIGLGALFAAIQFLHLRLIAATLRGDRPR